MLFYLQFNFLLMRQRCLLYYGHSWYTIKQLFNSVLTGQTLLLSAEVLRFYTRFVVIKRTEIVEFLFPSPLEFILNELLILSKYLLLLLPLLFQLLFLPFPLNLNLPVQLFNGQSIILLLE